MSNTLVDSDVLLDVLTEDPTWFDWSSAAIESHAEHSMLVIDPLISAEVSIRCDRSADRAGGGEHRSHHHGRL